MGKIYIEDSEIKISEKEEEVDNEYQINNDKYVMSSTVKVEFKSSIYTYGDEKVLISKINRFNEDYYKIVIFNDNVKKAWNLLELPEKLQIRIKRYSVDTFVVVGDNREDNHTPAQVSFCKLKPSTKVEEITVNFAKLNDIFFFKNEIVIAYDDNIGDKAYHTLVVYNSDGKLLQTLFEFCDGDDVTYSYELLDNKLKITKKR